MIDKIPHERPIRRLDWKELSRSNRRKAWPTRIGEEESRDVLPDGTLDEVQVRGGLPYFNLLKLFVQVEIQYAK